MNPTVIVAAIILSVAAFLLIEVSNGSIMNKLSFSDLLTLAKNAGFSGQDAVTAAGIALAESSGNPRAYNPEAAANAPTGKGSYGLWQIFLNAHPEFSGMDLYDSTVNAQAAFSVYQAAGNSFSPWSTFNNGQYASLIPAGYNA